MAVVGDLEGAVVLLEPRPPQLQPTLAQLLGRSATLGRSSSRAWRTTLRRQIARAAPSTMTSTWRTRPRERIARAWASSPIHTVCQMALRMADRLRWLATWEATWSARARGEVAGGAAADAANAADDTMVEIADGAKEVAADLGLVPDEEVLDEPEPAAPPLAPALEGPSPMGYYYLDGRSVLRVHRGAHPKSFTINCYRHPNCRMLLGESRCPPDDDEFKAWFFQVEAPRPGASAGDRKELAKLHMKLGRDGWSAAAARAKAKARAAGGGGSESAPAS